MKSVLDDSHDWKRLNDGRLMRTHPAGFRIVRPEKITRHVPYECPHCGQMMRHPDDPTEYLRYGCCTFCVTNWVHGENKQKWLDGWRPPKEDVELRLGRRTT